MIAATVTLNIGLFIFFLLLAFIIGLFVAFFASASAVNASIREHDRERRKMTITMRPIMASESTNVE